MLSSIKYPANIGLSEMYPDLFSERNLENLRAKSRNSKIQSVQSLPEIKNGGFRFATAGKQPLLTKKVRPNMPLSSARVKPPLKQQYSSEERVNSRRVQAQRSRVRRETGAIGTSIQEKNAESRGQSRSLPGQKQCKISSKPSFAEPEEDPVNLQLAEKKQGIPPLRLKNVIGQGGALNTTSRKRK